MNFFAISIGANENGIANHTAYRINKFNYFRIHRCALPFIEAFVYMMMLNSVFGCRFVNESLLFFISNPKKGVVFSLPEELIRNRFVTATIRKHSGSHVTTLGPLERGSILGLRG